MSVSIIAPYDISLAAGLEFYPSAGSPVLTRLIYGGETNTNIKLSLPMIGADDSIELSDVSTFKKTATRVGAPFISHDAFTGWPPLGTGSLFCPTVSDYYTFPNHADYDLAAVDGWVEFFLYVTSLASVRGVLASGTSGGQTNIYIYTNGTLAIGRAAINEIATPAATVAANTKHHVRITKISGTTKIYVDGVEKVSSATAVWYGAPGEFLLGKAGSNGGNIYIDTFKWVKGETCVDFSVPTTEASAYPLNSPAATHKFNIPGASIADIVDCLNYLENSLGGTGSLSYGYQLNGGSLVSGQTLAQLKAAVRNTAITVHTDSLIVYVSHVSNGATQAESAIKMGGGLHVIDPVGGGGISKARLINTGGF